MANNNGGAAFDLALLEEARMEVTALGREFLARDKSEDTWVEAYIAQMMREDSDNPRRLAQHQRFIAGYRERDSRADHTVATGAGVSAVLIERVERRLKATLGNENAAPELQSEAA